MGSGIKKLLEKPRYSYSKFRNYFDCPKRFDLALYNKPYFSDNSKATMDQGKILEAILWYDKDSVLPKYRGKSAYNKMAFLAGFLKEQKVFRSAAKKSAFLKIEHEFPYYTVRGEIDYLGKVTVQDQFSGQKINGRFITDLKKTNDAAAMWGSIRKKSDVFQVVLYSYIHFLKTGEMLDGLYVIIEDKMEGYPMVVCKRVLIDEDSYRWIRNFMDNVHFDFGRTANHSKKTCLGVGAFSRRCAYLQHCDEGKNLLGGLETFEFNALY